MAEKHEKHPLAHVFKGKDPLLETFFKPTQKVEVKSRGGQVAKHIEYGVGDIDDAIEKLAAAVSAVTAGVPEAEQNRRIQLLLAKWSDFLQERNQSRYFIPHAKAVESYRQQVRLNAIAGGQQLSEGVVEVEANRLAETAIAAQKASLAEWVLYLTKKSGPDYVYPPRFQALAFKSITDRASTTINPVPPVHSAALSNIAAHMEPYLKGASSAEEQTRELKRFSELYAAEMHRLDAEQRALRESSEIKDGTWKTFSARDMRTIRKLCKNTPLCLKDEGWVRHYTGNGQKLRMYLTKDEHGRYALPRIVICFKQRGKKKTIIEMRGIDGANQHLEQKPELAILAQEEANGYENGAGYVKKANDVLTLAKLTGRIKQEKENATKYRLTSEELRRLYEIDERFEDFGRGAHISKAADLRKGRDAMKDAEIIFGAIANSVQDIENKLKSGIEVGAYISPISADVWSKIGNIQHIYTSFPEGKKTRREIRLKETSSANVRRDLKKVRVSIGDYANDMLGGIPAEDLQNAESFPVFTLQVRDLFTPEELEQFAEEHKKGRRSSQLPTTKDIFGEQGPDGKFDLKRIHALGLDVCPATVAANILAEHADTLSSERWEFVATHPISDRDGDPSLFGVGRRDDGALDLDSRWAGPEGEWDLGGRIVFRPRK